MRRVVVDHYGGPEVLTLVEERDPLPGPGEVLVKVLAAGVSYTDAKAVRHVLGKRPGGSRAPRRGRDRLPQRGLPGACARAAGKGVDVVLDGLGGALSLRSFRALRRGGRLVVCGHSSTISFGHRSWRGWLEWYSATAAGALWGLLSPSRSVSAYRIQKLRDGHQFVPMGSRRPLPVGGGPRNPLWFREDFLALLELLREGRSTPSSRSGCR
jgi:hypothetical protein